jgi:hypothetical protein
MKTGAVTIDYLATHGAMAGSARRCAASLTLINNSRPLFLNHASLRKHLREMNMAQWDPLALVNTHVAALRQGCP